MTTTTQTVHPTVPGHRPPGRWPRRSPRGAAVVGAVMVAGAAVVGAGGSQALGATPTVQVETNPTFGAILADGAGDALYTLNTDHDGQSTCHGSCAAAWPPLNVAAGSVPSAGPGVTGAVGTSRQANGTTQVTYDGSPLYTFVGDTAPGQVTGNNVSGFFAVTAGLTTTTTTVAPTPTTTTPPAAGASSAGTPPVSPPVSPATSSSSSGPATAPAHSPAPAVSSSAPGSLAFTGTGPGLRWLLLLGLLFVALGTACTLARTRRHHVGAVRKAP